MVAAAAEGDAPPKLEEAARPHTVDGQGELLRTVQGVIDSPDEGGADVVFEVGGKRFGGLRSLLALRCDVLGRMLSGSFREATSAGPLRFPEYDVCPGMFREFLCYLHTGASSLSGAVDAMHLFEIAKFFGVQRLVDSCAQCLQEVQLEPGMAVSAVHFALRHDLWGLLVAAWRIIGRDADTALGDPREAAKLPSRLLSYLFESRHSNASEISLIRILSELSQEQREELQGFIRLPLLSPKEMMEVVVPSKLFQLEDCVAAMAYQNDPESVSFSTTSAQPRRFVWLAGFECGLQSSPAVASSREGAGQPSQCGRSGRQPRGRGRVAALASKRASDISSAVYEAAGAPPSVSSHAVSPPLAPAAAAASPAALPSTADGAADGWCMGLASYLPDMRTVLQEAEADSENSDLHQKNVETVMSHVQCSKAVALSALQSTNNDIRKAVIQLAAGRATPTNRSRQLQASSAWT